MTGENISQKFRLKNMDGTRNCFIEEINESKLMSEKHKMFVILNCVEHLLIVTSTTTGCVSISDFTSLLRIPVDISTFAIGLKNCVITAGIKSYDEQW